MLKAQYFSKIDADLVGDIIYTQSDSMSIRLVGPKAEVERMQVSFKGDKLIIEMEEKDDFSLFGNKRSGVDVYVSGPDLTELKVEGVSDFKAKKIDTDYLSATIDGVGDIQIDTLVCDHFKGFVDGRPSHWLSRGNVGQCVTRWHGRYQAVDGQSARREVVD